MTVLDFFKGVLGYDSDAGWSSSQIFFFRFRRVPLTLMRAHAGVEKGEGTLAA